MTAPGKPLLWSRPTVTLPLRRMPTPTRRSSACQRSPRRTSRSSIRGKPLEFRRRRSHRLDHRELRWTFKRAQHCSRSQDPCRASAGQDNEDQIASLQYIINNKLAYTVSSSWENDDEILSVPLKTMPSTRF